MSGHIYDWYFIECGIKQQINNNRLTSGQFLFLLFRNANEQVTLTHYYYVFGDEISPQKSNPCPVKYVYFINILLQWAN